MILTELKTYLMKHRAVNLLQLATELHTEPTAMRAMLQHWIHKGCVRQCPKLPGCGTQCGRCNPLLTEIYEWVYNGSNG